MTETTDFPLSTKSKRLVRDIHFAMNIGRDSPFDPFKGRDMTRLFSEKKEPSMGLMHFAHKPERRTMSTSIVFSKIPGRAPTQSVFKSYYNPEPTATTYSPNVPLRGPHPHISFPRAKRVPLENIGVTDILEKWQQPKNGAKDHVVSGEAVGAGLMSAPDDLLSCRERAKLRSEQRERSASRMTARLLPPRVKTAESRTVAPPRAAEFELPWETKKKRLDEAALAKNKRTMATSQKQGHITTPGGPANVAFSTTGVDLDELSMTPDELAINPDAGRVSVAGQPSHENRRTSAENEEDWLRKRQLMLARYGLVGSSHNRSRRGGAPTGINFALVPGREAPIGYQRPLKELKDNHYEPKDSVTTKTRAVAHVELGKQASRPDTDNRLIKHINSLLDYSHLSRLQRKSRREEIKSLMGLSAASVDETSKSVNMSPVLERPLTAADELSYHYDSLKAPPTNTPKPVPHTSDAYLWAGRDNEPIASVLGGDIGPYRRAAQKEVALQQRSPSVMS